MPCPGKVIDIIQGDLYKFLVILKGDILYLAIRYNKEKIGDEFFEDSNSKILLSKVKQVIENNKINYVNL